VLKRVDYDQVQHDVYAGGRAMPPGSLEAWLDAFATYWPPLRPLQLLDLGSGIGRFTPGLAERFGGPVYGVEPAAKMRAIAQASASHPAVSYLAGEASRIPLKDAAVDGALMFLSLHHVPDIPSAATEIVRVLRPAGRLQIVSGFSDRTAGASWWHQFFPRAGEIERLMFPSVAGVVDPFASAGLAFVTLDRVPTLQWESIAAAAQQLRLRPYSTFEHLTEREIVEGLARLDRAARDETSPSPIVGLADRLVLEKTKG
jgi:ubiquinone/menaquinone biosynthesis C-methylase UbiE